MCLQVVVLGARPSVPADMPEDYVLLMKRCGGGSRLQLAKLEPTAESASIYSGYLCRHSRKSALTLANAAMCSVLSHDHSLHELCKLSAVTLGQQPADHHSCYSQAVEYGSDSVLAVGGACVTHKGC